MPAETARMIGSPTLLRVENLRKEYMQRKLFGRPKHVVVALDGVDLTLRRGSLLGLMGESGCGKSTLARCLAGLERPNSGSLWFDGTDLARLSSHSWRAWHPRIQMVYQDSANSFNPRFSAEAIVREPLDIQNVGTRASRATTVRGLMERVGLPQNLAGRTADQFSGGQRQRLAIARALALQPELLILDESFSALDLWTQSQLAKLISRLRVENSITCIHIAHDFSLLTRLCDEIAVMRTGQIIEQAVPEELLANPRHAYTRKLLATWPLFERVREGVA
jgi:oligopeptide transport system ATP-binding protein